MSEQTIARWNAISIDRAPGSTSLKRGRPEDEAEADDDDISLVSRSPSPLPRDAMDVDESSIHKYDEYVRGPAREVITVETKIGPANKGFALLQKLGWREGQPVGLSADGRTEPVPFYQKSDSTGLGKTSQDVRMIETTVSQRRGLDSERQQRETEEQRQLRENSVARKSALEAEISSTLRAFYCELCDKQFKTVAQYDEHTNSYAHHHKARFKDMQANVRLKPQSEIDKRKEKERKREEKELRKIAAANGIKMPKPPAAVGSATLPGPDVLGSSSNMDVDGAPVEPKKGGWATVSGNAGMSGSTSTLGSSKKSGWATFGSTSSSSQAQSSNAVPPSSDAAPPGDSKSQFRPSYDLAGPSMGQPSSHTPAFRNAGWTSLDTGSSQLSPSPAPAPPPPPQPSHYQPPPPPPPSTAPSQKGGWARVSAPSVHPPPPQAGQWSRNYESYSPQPPTNALPPPLPPPPAPLPVAPPSEPLSLPPPPPEPKPVRSNWQQFQKGVGRRK